MNEMTNPNVRQNRYVFDCPLIKEMAVLSEMFETDAWAADAILDVELMPQLIHDPCCGRGILAGAAKNRGYNVAASDLLNWGYGTPWIDYLDDSSVEPFLAGWTKGTGRALLGQGFGVFMNPPFSLAAEFVRQALALGARKVLCFQRQAWYESDRRDEFWNGMPPNRTWTCIDRAETHRIDISPERRRKLSRAYPHAWYVWEPKQPIGNLSGRLRNPFLKSRIRDRCPAGSGPTNVLSAKPTGAARLPAMPGESNVGPRFAGPPTG